MEARTDPRSLEHCPEAPQFLNSYSGKMASLLTGYQPVLAALHGLTEKNRIPASTADNLLRGAELNGFSPTQVITDAIGRVSEMLNSNGSALPVKVILPAPLEGLWQFLDPLTQGLVEPVPRRSQHSTN